MCLYHLYPPPPHARLDYFLFFRAPFAYFLHLFSSARTCLISAVVHPIYHDSICSGGGVAYSDANTSTLQLFDAWLAFSTCFQSSCQADLTSSWLYLLYRHESTINLLMQILTRKPVKPIPPNVEGVV